MILRPAFIFPIPNLVPTNIQFTEQDMGEAIITCSVAIPADIEPDFSIDGSWTVSFRGEIYNLKTFLPPGKKDTASLQYQYELTFISEREDLKHRLFATFVQLGDGSLQIFSQTIPFSADLLQFVDRLNQNLRYNYGSRWRAEINPSLPIDSLAVTVQANNASIWDVLTQTYGLYGVRWYIEVIAGQMVIRIGYNPVEIGHVFEYGKDNGLVSIERVNPLDQIYTRLYGRGGTRNIPVRYFKDAADGYAADPDTNTNLQTGFFPNLMPSSTRAYIQGWNDAGSGLSPNPPSDPIQAHFYNLGFDDQRSGRNMYLPNQAESDNIEKWGIREGVLEDNEMIYPSIQGVWLSNKGRADEVVDVEAVLNDDYNTGDTNTLAPSISAKVTMAGTQWIGSSVINSNPITVIDSGSISMSLALAVEGIPVLLWDSGFTVDVTVSIVNSSSGDVVASEPFDLRSFYPRTRVPGLSGWTFENIPAGTYSVRISLDTFYGGPRSYPSAWVSCDAGSIEAKSNSDAGEYKPTFDIWIKDIWEEAGTIEEIWGTKISTSDMAVMFSNGDIAGEDYEFVVAQSENGNPLLPDPKGGYWHIWEDSSRSILTQTEEGSTVSVPSRWRLSLIKSEAELDASNMMLPNKNRNAKAGDHFFFINIELPHKYVLWAEERLQSYLQAELTKVDEEYPTFSVKPSAIFCENFNESDLLRVGAKLRLRNERLLGDGYTPIYINSLTMRFHNDKILPEWDLTISDKLIGNQSPIALLQGEIKRLSLNSGGYGISQDAIRSIEKIFLRKDGVADTSYSPTTFARDITFNAKATSGDFKQGDFGGAGWGFYDDSNEASVLEVDKLVVRRQMRVNEVLVNQIIFTGGKQVFSAAGATIERVEEGNGYWRCYIDTKMASLMNHFQLGDQAYHQDFDIENQEILRYYWRLVVGVGIDYIDLSMTDADGESVPQANDNIAQLGNRSDASRQSALVIDMVRDGGGLVTWYDNINAYSLVAKDAVNIGRIDGETWVQAYGNAYFGRRDESRYFRVRDGQAEIKGVLAVSMADDGATDYVTVYRGEWEVGTTYAQGDEVLWGGVYYVYINPNPSAGHETDDGDYWRVRSQGAEAQSMYTWIKYSDYKNPQDDQIFDSPTATPSGNASWIGQAFNKPTPTESSVATDYVWLPFLNTDGRDGNSQEFIFRRTTNTNPPTPPVEQYPVQQTDGYVPPNWTANPTGVDSISQWEWVSTRKKINESWTQFSVAALWSKYGEDGNGVQYIYYRSRTNVPPATPSGDAPAGWTDNPSGTDATYRYEFVSSRKYQNESWTAWSAPALAFIYALDGGGLKVAYCRSVAQPLAPAWSRSSDQNSITPITAGWSVNAPVTPADQPLWMSSGTARLGTDNLWGVPLVSTPVQVNGPAGFNGRSLVFMGDYKDNIDYTATTQTAAVVYRSPYFYYTVPQASGAIRGVTPPNVNYWTQFQGSFQNVATNVLFANEGQLGDFRFYRNGAGEGVFESADGLGNIILNSKTGRAEFRTGQIAGFNISNGTIAWDNPQYPGEMIGATMQQNLFRVRNRDYAGNINFVAINPGNFEGSSGIELWRSTIAGFGIYATSTSTSRNIGDGLGKMYNYIQCTNTTSRITITLPDPSGAESWDGHVVYIRRNYTGAGSVDITTTGTTARIDRGNSIVRTVNLDGIAGSTGMFVNVGNYWRFNYLPAVEY